MSSKNSGLSRRIFVSSGVAASVHFWVPKPVTGYTGGEMRDSLVEGQVVKAGVSKRELDTPALVVDLDKMEKNVATMQAAVKKFGIADPPARQDTQVRGDRQVSDEDRIDRHLLREAQRGGSARGQRRGSDSP